MDEPSLSILDAVSALVVVLDREGRINHWNRACTALTGYSLSEVRTKLVSEFLVLPEEREALRIELARVLRAPGPRQFENYWITKDGCRRWIGWSSVASIDAGGAERIVATGIDRTEQKEAQEALRISEAKMRGILSVAADAVIAVDEDQRIVIYNEGAALVFGWSSQEAVGQPLEILLPERFRALHRHHIAEFAGSGGTTRRMAERSPAIFGLRKNGEEFPAEGEISKLETEQGSLLIVILRDVSDQKEIERSLRREIRVRDELTRTIVHDLRNPLSAIAMQAELLMPGDGASSGRAEPINRIRRSAQRMARLLDDLLDVASIEAGRLSMNKSMVSIARLLAEAVDTTRPLASASGVDLCEELERDLPLVEVDRIRILQVLDNLIGNAIKFTPEGGCVRVAATSLHKEVQVTVRDDGPGIPAEQMEHLFEAFWQARLGDRRGAGLGLAIAKGIVEAHGGRIWVESTPGNGAAFCFSLRAHPMSVRKPLVSSHAR